MHAARTSDRDNNPVPTRHDGAGEPPVLVLAATLGVILALVGVLTTPALVVIGGVAAAVSVACAAPRPATTPRQAGRIRRDPTVARSASIGAVPKADDAPQRSAGRGAS